MTGSWWQFSECSFATIAMLGSILLGVIAIALISLIITIPVALAFLAGSAILALVSFILIIKLLVKDGFTNLTTWCKINVILCIVVMCILIGQIVTISIQNEHVSNAITPAPTTP